MYDGHHIRGYETHPNIGNRVPGISLYSSESPRQQQPTKDGVSFTAFVILIREGWW